MTDKELQKTLREKIEHGDCFNKEVQNILIDYKNSGGQQEDAEKLVEQLAVNFSSDEIFQYKTYEMLDIITGWGSYGMRVWDKKIPERLMDGLQFEDNETGVIFNHFSYCEYIKHMMVKYGKINYFIASETVNDSFLAKKPRTINDITFLTHEVSFHWAMLLVHGDMYWARGIPSNVNEFKDDYLAWKTGIKKKYNLKEEYIYYDKPKS